MQRNSKLFISITPPFQKRPNSKYIIQLVDESARILQVRCGAVIVFYVQYFFSHFNDNGAGLNLNHP